MLTAYVVLDGFDLGAGALHQLVARTDGERRQVLAAIGPFWDGNEVWLLATGGALIVAFPPVLASGLSGFYFAIFLVLWTLILRGISIEFRSHVDGRCGGRPGTFSSAVASTLLPLLFGAALGNLVRGLPIDAQGGFSLPLFTNFSARPPVGILDWYTIAAGLFAVVAIAAHGATFLAWKTDGEVGVAQPPRRLQLSTSWSRPLAGRDRLTSLVNPDMFARNSRGVPWPGCRSLVAFGGLACVAAGLRRQSPLLAFLGSCAYLFGHAGGHRRLHVSGDAASDR